MTKSKTTKTTVKTTPKSSIIPDTPVVVVPKKVSSKPAPIKTPKIVASKPVDPVLPPPSAPIEEVKPEIIQPQETQNPLNIVSFYGHHIRSVYTKNQWYFCLEDILKVANVIDPTKFLIDLKNQTDLKDNYYQLVDSFSYQENNNPIIIPVVNYQSFIQVLPFIRQIGSIIPGPFPEWLKNMANRSL